MKKKVKWIAVDGFVEAKMCEVCGALTRMLGMRDGVLTYVCIEPDCKTPHQVSY